MACGIAGAQPTWRVSWPGKSCDDGDNLTEVTVSLKRLITYLLSPPAMPTKKMFLDTPKQKGYDIRCEKRSYSYFLTENKIWKSSGSWMNAS